MFVNRPHPHDPKLQINCRNIWFNEFWSQHHKCSFDTDDQRHPRCTGNETLMNYEQEGLVPFVGNWINLFIAQYINFMMLTHTHTHKTNANIHKILYILMTQTFFFLLIFGLDWIVHALVWVSFFFHWEVTTIFKPKKKWTK